MNFRVKYNLKVEDNIGGSILNLNEFHPCPNIDFQDRNEEIWEDFSSLFVRKLPDNDPN